MAGDWLTSGGAGGRVDVHELVGLESSWKGLLDIVDAGALVSLGTTSDGGALAVTVTVNGEWRRDYFRHPDELQAWVAEAVPGVRALMPDDRPSAVADGRSRRRRTR